MKLLMDYILKKHEINGCWVFEALYPPKLKQLRHTHLLATFSFVLSGSYLEEYGRQTSVRKSSTVIFHPPHESHAVSYESDVRILSVHFDFKRFAQLREHSIILDESSICRSETVAWLGRQIHREFRGMDSFSSLSIEGLVLELLAESSRSRFGTDEKSVPLYLLNVKDFLHDNFAESFLLEDVVKIAGVHPVHLSRIFRKKFGCTIGEYVRRLRVEFAARQILLSDAPLGEIAHAAGFFDHSHFNRTFKSFYGLTPNQYRQSSRRG
jgi:AraC family transcriptional regulator